MNSINNPNDPHLLKIEKPKVSGLNHLWDGPLDTSNYPKGKGYSGGKNGIELKFDDPSYNSMPITQRAKNRR